MFNRLAKLRIASLLSLNVAVIFVTVGAMTVIAGLGMTGGAGIAAVALGIAALALNLFFAWWINRSLAHPLQEAVALGRSISAGDLTASFKGQATGEVAEILHVFEDIKDSLSVIVRDVRGGSIAIDTTAGRVKNDTTAWSSRNEEQAVSIEKTAASMEQLTSIVKNNADNAAQANQLVASTSDLALKGGHLVKDVVSTMDAIKQSSHKIVDIISVIDGIAFQTNILALNAAVEAARAGEQGRGFAVVAAEVRSLAQRSAEAAKEIKHLITDSVEKVNSGGQLVDAAGQTMEEIVTSVKHVAGFMSDIASASQEESAGISQISESIIVFDKTAHESAELVAQALTSAVSLKDNASTLSQSVSHFKMGSEVGNADEALALVKKAVKFAGENGLDGLLEDVNKLNKGHFIHKDLYIGIYDDKGVVRAHGANRHFLNSEAINMLDPDGKPFIRDMIATGMGNGSGWVNYKFAHPVTQEIKRKSVYVERVGNMVVTCGCYAA
ncbi:methyl-accepting chemotaxis protein [Noviherbaspirillum sp.]|jgi:methyl-accepting chemotaxis protein|uniref:methyl-accepting chemotaxis protein n=1 Tax=Noviherbaspirillum sp. TaxID=1926288 RepID=UPI0025F0F491|nr:methyl-accepting chemotaxis protein [Noviherbaspirillum sp.]